MKTFTAITSQIHNNKLVLLCASDGRSIHNANGLDFATAIDFLFGLRYGAKAEKGNVFVCYAFSRDNEFLFKDLPTDVKDRLFKSHYIRKQVAIIDEEQEHLDGIYFTALPHTQEFQEADFFRHVNFGALKELNRVEYGGYKLHLAQGKRLVIRKGGKQIVIHDIFGFFNCPLRQAVKTWIGKDSVFLDREYLNLDDSDITQQLKSFAMFEVGYIERLAVTLNSELEAAGIKLRSFHGSGAVTTWMLSQSKARNRENPQYYNYRYPRQLAPKLRKAVMQAFFAGRAEQFKIGTGENVNVYDINGAYAYGASLLPIMKRKPNHSREWRPEPFSLWNCEYDFRGVDPYFGFLPNREIKGQVTYRTRGAGCFWQPEIHYLLRYYPECIDIKDGYYLPYERAPFTDNVLALYELRKMLQVEKNPLEKIIKLALAAIYGKFCQTTGKGEYVNMFYAGFITSLTRMQLLDATRGLENQTVCFLTDAIHTTAKLDIPVSYELGEYKLTEYAKGTYLDNGIYRVIDKAGAVKEKSCGFKTFDFDAALADLQNRRQFSTVVEYFTGHNLHTLQPIRYNKYLEMFDEKQENAPLANTARQFENRSSINLDVEFLDSAVYSLFGGRESKMYLFGNVSDKRKGLDSIAAGRK